MQILPVIDLMQGQVVRGVGGHRDEYRPIVSQVCADARPESVARAFVASFGFRETYVADLDAIAGAEPAWGIYRALLDAGLGLWVDAGIADVERARALAGFQHANQPLSAIVAGLESLPAPEILRELVEMIGPERLVFSLDLKHGQPLMSSSAWQSLDPLTIAQRAIDIGVRRMIVLDLARVGMSDGVGTENLCRQLRQVEPSLEITSGGGVRGVADLDSLAAAGCNFALVASALHDGRITPEQVRAREPSPTGRGQGEGSAAT